MKDEKMRGLMIEMKEKKKEYCVYMYGVFIVECISLSLLTTKYVYLKFLFISVQKKLNCCFLHLCSVLFTRFLKQELL